MNRLLTCALACLLMTAPCWAQPSFRVADRAENQKAFTALELSRSAPTVATVEEAAALRTEQRMKLGRRAGEVAATVVRTLAAQNKLTFGVPTGEMDAYLRPPSSGSSRGEATFLREAKEIYDDAKDAYDSATTFGTERYDFRIDPMSLKCRLKVRLGR